MVNGRRYPDRPRRARRVVVPAVIAAAGVALGSVAWACVPNIDKRTLVQSCSAPAESTKPCKTPIGQPTFPEATFVKGPSGSNLVAYVNGDGMEVGMPYDLLFIGKPLVTAGTPCASSSATVISTGTGAVGNINGGISPTSGQIPANSPLGGGQICFADKSRTLSSSDTAVFKVTV